MKTIFDAMFYVDQPAQHRRMLRPLLIVDDGMLNRSTEPEAYNSGVDSPGSDFAFRRVARDAIGVERGVWQNTYKTPADYDPIPQPVCLDFEAHDFDMSASPRRRLARIDWLCRGIDAMRGEAKHYGRTVTVGSYYPLLPAYFGDTRDPRCAGWLDASMHDFAPLLERLDASHPGCEIHGDDLEEWKAGVRRTLDALATALPGKPVYPLLPPHYSHFTQDQAKKHTPLPLPLWRAACEWLFAQGDVAGVTLWGGADLRNDPNRRLPWSEAENYVSQARMAALLAGKNTNQ